MEKQIEKKVRQLLDKAHLMDKQGWEGDKVDGIEMKELLDMIQDTREEGYNEGMEEAFGIAKEELDKLIIKRK